MLDSTDIAIIEQLKKDGRSSMRKIAEEIDVAPSTASARFERLKEEEIITGFQPVVDYEKIGFELTTVMEVRSDPQMISDLAERLQEKKNIISFFEVTGSTDMVLIGKFVDRKDLNSFLKKLQKTDGVRSTETHMVLTSPKIHGGVDLETLK